MYIGVANFDNVVIAEVVNIVVFEVDNVVATVYNVILLKLTMSLRCMKLIVSLLL